MIQIQGDFFTGGRGCYRGLVGFAAPRLMSFPDWDLLSVLTPEIYNGTNVVGPSFFISSPEPKAHR